MSMSQRILPLLVLSICCQTASAQSLGTLFTTPSQREYLDSLRTRFMSEQALGSFDIDQQIELPPEQNNTAPTQILYQLSGIMTRSDGSRLIWLNGEALTAGELPSGFRLREDGRALLISYQEDIHTLYPGQTIDLQDGSLREAYEPRDLPAADSNRVEAIQTADDSDAPVGPLFPLRETLQEQEPATSNGAPVP